MFIVKIWFMRREDPCHLCPILRILSVNKKTFCVYLVSIRRLSAYTKYKKEDTKRAYLSPKFQIRTFFWPGPDFLT